MTEQGTDNTGSAGAENNGANPAPTGAEKPETITMTKDELNELISERVNKLNASWEKKMADKAKADSDKAEIDKLQGEEKLKKQYQIEVDKLQKERDDFSRSLKIAKAEVSLSSKGLDPKFAESLIGATDEETNSKIESFAKMVEDQVSKTIKANTAKGAPPVPNATSSDPQRDAIMRGFGVQ